MVPTNNQVFEPKSQRKISQNSSNTIQFLEIFILKSLNEVLENDGDNGLDHSYSPLEKFQVDIDLSLNSLPFTPEPASNTFFQELQLQIPTKLPGFQYIA